MFKASRLQTEQREQVKIRPFASAGNISMTVAWSVLLMVVSNLSAAPFAPGNLLITQANTLYEYTRSGAVVQSAIIPYPAGVAMCPPCENARDVTFVNFERAAVFNGTFDPYLSSFNAVTEEWSHQTYPGLSVANNTSYGGLTSTTRYVFMPDMNTANDAPQGIVRFDLQGGPTIRFAQDLAPLDLNIGLDGLLYALDPSADEQIQVFDPISTALLKTLDVNGANLRAVDADSDGSIFTVSFLATIYHFGSNGNLISSLNLQTSNTIDVDLASDGSIVVGERFGLVSLTNRDFAALTHLQLASGAAFVDFVPAPEPPLSAICVTFSLLLLFRPIRSKHQFAPRAEAFN